MPSQLSVLTRRSVIQGLGAVTAASFLSDFSGLSAFAAARSSKLPRTSPEAAGIAPGGILAFLDTVDAKVGGLHSFMLLRQGQVAAEGWWAPYRPEFPHMLYSLSKSFTSTAVGFAVSEGKLKVDDLVVSFFPDKLPQKRDENLDAMRVRHLLTMNTGHDKDATGPVTSAPDGDWVKMFLSLPVEHAPGTKFVYNSAATYMLSAIVQKLTGMRVVDYLKPRLFDAIGIQGETWETCPKGINCGGWGLSVKTEDIARFGQCYLQKGKWGDRQAVPASWVEEATSKQVSNGNGGDSDWTQGYGYQFWRCRHNAFRGDGAFGQYCVVMPDHDAVLAITSGVSDMQAVLNAVWDHLLPAMSSPTGGSEESVSLRRRIANLQVPAPSTNAPSTMSQHVSGKKFQFDASSQNVKAATFDFSPDRCTLTLATEQGDQKIVSGSRDWMKGTLPRTASLAGLGAPPAGRIAAKGAWTADDTYTMKVCYVETPYVETITCQFSGNQVSIARKMNVAFGPTERPRLTGRTS